MEKKNWKDSKIRKLSGLIPMFLLFGCMSLFGLKPEWSNGMLFFRAEASTFGRTDTGFYAMASGVSTWFQKYEQQIFSYACYYKTTDYYATLPGYGYTLVTADKLAGLIKLDTDLGLGYVSNEVVQLMQDKLILDKNSSTTPGYPKDSNYVWDPYGLWKWRSVYMENRYAENGNSTRIHANCWGTADYLTRSSKWADYYPESKASFFINNPSAPAWAGTFPRIYLNGSMNYTYSIDKDLYENSWRFTLLADAYQPNIRNYLNSFDVIRMSDLSSTSSGDLIIGSKDLGNNLHCAAYLCTDYAGYHWYYQKGNYGETSSAPYGIWAFGKIPPNMYENCYRSLFRHDYDYKLNLSDSYDENWAGITP
jgi:hypothetical protein